MTSSSSSSSSPSADTIYKFNNRVIQKKSCSSSSSSTRPSNLYHLKSLISSGTPPPQPQPVLEMREINGLAAAAAAEVELDPHECLEGDSSSSWSSWNPAATMTSSSTTSISQQKKAFNPKEDEEEEEEEEEEDDDGGCCINVDFEEEEEEDAIIFKPSIKIRKLDVDSIHISTIVMKEVSLTSTLFSLLEEEKLDIVFEDHYRTETKAAHSIQVRVQPGYIVDALETKLRSWARCTPI